ncbi:piwi-like protein Ago3 [Nilaparvata lugens]|uniref:piwi-like protein Ago3 n=1 Tax=Nilaparvata lugens TaxID=108931 RepID=UPI00193C9818|nr:piwi-like protein Ago3 [Nilaparvata lugens]XP_039282739.1 piwi-like protein Ago3 [Nilaparvata lugens]
MAGRGSGGRGDRLRELLSQMEEEEKQKKAAAEAAQALLRAQAPPQPMPGFSVGRGRGILGALSQSAAASSEPAPIRPMGRGAMMSSLIAQRTEPSVSRPIEKVTEAVESLSLQPRAKPMPVADRPPEVHTGTSGTQISMTSNYIRLQCDPDKGMFEYFVRFIPEVDNVKLKYDLLSTRKDIIGDTRTFDGQTLYLPKLLKDQVTYLDAVSKLDQSRVQIEITFQRKRNLAECVHFYNVLFNRIMHILNFIRFGRSTFNPKEAVPIPEYRLEVWPGYVTAIENHEGGLLICCDVSSRVLRKVTAHQIIQDVLQGSRSGDYKEIVQATLIGNSVMTDYNKKLYRVDDIDFTINPSDTFVKAGKEVSFIDYYKQAYGISIKDSKQPMLLHREKLPKGVKKVQDEPKMIALVPELCYMTGLTDEMRSDFKVMKRLNMVTSLPPNLRQAKLKKFIQIVNQNPDTCALLANWGLQMDIDSIPLTGRLLEPEKIIFKNDRYTKSDIADWKREAGEYQMLEAVSLENWAVICTRRDDQIAKSFIDAMRKVAPRAGMMVNSPQIQNLDNDKPQSYVSALRAIIQSGLQIVVIFFPTRREDRYAAVKSICLVENPIPSQVIIATKLRGPKTMAITQKIALQMNCKLGGTLWGVNIPFGDTMICGLDSYHDPSRRGASWVGFIASINREVTRWYSQVVQQGVGQEFVDVLQPALIAALNAFNRENGKFPTKVVFFRDGVGDGQLKTVHDHEVPQLENVMRSIQKGYEPKIAFIIVQKRINTRLFTLGRREEENPLPGTVMDHTITRRYYYDFFIVSQHVTQGTVAPTHYLVIYDTLNWKPDMMQRLAYKMCHLYYNWPGTVRVPAPTQYAHKLAYLVGQVVRKKPSAALNDTLYFL